MHKANGTFAGIPRARIFFTSYSSRALRQNQTNSEAPSTCTTQPNYNVEINCITDEGVCAENAVAGQSSVEVRETADGVNGCSSRSTGRVSLPHDTAVTATAQAAEAHEPGDDSACGALLTVQLKAAVESCETHGRFVWLTGLLFSTVAHQLSLQQRQ